jgi:hypothetical protein
VRSLEKPIGAADYAAQLPHLDTAREIIRTLRLPSLDALELSLRGKVYTALLRLGRQTTADTDPVREEARKRIHLSLAELWRALGNEQRAATAFEAGGRTKNAAAILRQSGQWDDVARLFEREGKHADAARLFEAHHADVDAARCHRAAGDLRSAFRCLLKAGDVAAVRSSVRELETAAGVELLLRVGAAELADELLVERGEWTRVAQLREQRRNFEGAAEAREKAGDLDKAAIDWRRAGNEKAVESIAERSAAPLLEGGDKLGAAEVFARFRVFARAAPLALPERPERAHAWYSRAGMDSEALALAQKEARRALATNRFADAGAWHERAGDAPLAAEAYERAQLWSDALRVHEQLGQWEPAAKCCERLALLERAAEFYRRAGLDPPPRLQARLAPDLPGGS